MEVKEIGRNSVFNMNTAMFHNIAGGNCMFLCI